MGRGPQLVDLLGKGAPAPLASDQFPAGLGGQITDTTAAPCPPSIIDDHGDKSAMNLADAWSHGSFVVGRYSRAAARSRSKAWSKESSWRRRAEPAASATPRSSSTRTSGAALRRSPRSRRTASATARMRSPAPASGSWPRLERTSGRPVYPRGHRSVAQPGSAPALGAVVRYVPCGLSRSRIAFSLAPVLTDPACAQALP